jgi:hypothetical protein
MKSWPIRCARVIAAKTVRARPAGLVSTTGGADVEVALGVGVGPGVGVLVAVEGPVEAPVGEGAIDDMPVTKRGLEGAGVAPGNAPGQAAPGAQPPGSVAVGATITTARTAAVSVVAARAAAPRVDMVIAR